MDRRCDSNPTLLWLWCRLAATALSRPLAWELPYAAGGKKRGSVGILYSVTFFLKENFHGGQTLCVYALGNLYFGIRIKVLSEFF